MHLYFILFHDNYTFTNTTKNNVFNRIMISQVKWIKYCLKIWGQYDSEVSYTHKGCFYKNNYIVKYHCSLR